MSAPHEIVILGGSYAGLALAHGLSKTGIPAVQKATGKTFHITMISLSSHFHFSVASPRAVVDPTLIPIASLETPIKEKIPLKSDQFSFIHGEVTTFDHSTRLVSYTPLDDSYAKGEPTTIHYDSLFITLGSHTKHPAWKLRGSHTDLIAELEKLNKEITAASNIVIGGGGAIAVEVAGEIGSKYGSAKAVTLITNGPRLLHHVNPDIGTNAAYYLKQFGHHMVTDSAITNATILEGGKTHVEFGTKGESIDADLYIDATGIIPNNEPIPKDLLDSRGFLEVDDYQRVTKAGSLVYGMGDIVGKWAQVAEIAFIQGTVLGNWVFDASEGKTGAQKTYTVPSNSMILVPVGRKKGVATAFGWRFPSFFAWLIKGRDYMMGRSQVAITKGG